MKLKIDGEEVEFDLCTRNGMAEVFKIGTDQSGRRCRVACYTLPMGLFRHGGRVRTGGHEFEVTGE